jgi:hypothetical protein
MPAKILKSSSREDLSNQINEYVDKGWKSIEPPRYFPNTTIYNGKVYHIKSICTSEMVENQMTYQKIEHEYSQTIVIEKNEAV